MFEGRFHLEHAYRHMPGAQNASQCHLCLLVGLSNWRSHREPEAEQSAFVGGGGIPHSAQRLDLDIALWAGLASEYAALCIFFRTYHGAAAATIAAAHRNAMSARVVHRCQHLGIGVAMKLLATAFYCYRKRHRASSRQ
jgi:hypothetical protein